MVKFDENTALIVVDVQNDFADPNGSLYVSGGEQVVDPINETQAEARSSGALVVYTQDWHPENTPHFQKDGGIWPVHCVRDSWGADFHPDLEVSGPVVRKGVDGRDGYSGFTVRDPESGAEEGTELASVLAEADIHKVVVVGLATDYCVKETVLDAVEKGFETVVLTNEIRAVDLEAGDGEQALKAMESAGASLE